MRFAACLVVIILVTPSAFGGYKRKTKISPTLIATGHSLDSFPEDRVRLNSDKLGCNIRLLFPHIPFDESAPHVYEVPLRVVGSQNNGALINSYRDFKDVVGPLIQNWPSVLLYDWKGPLLGDELTVTTERRHQGKKRGELGLVLFSYTMSRRSTPGLYDGAFSLSISIPHTKVSKSNFLDFAISLFRSVDRFPDGTRFKTEKSAITNVRDVSVGQKYDFLFSVLLDKETMPLFYAQMEKLYFLSVNYLDKEFRDSSP